MLLVLGIMKHEVSESNVVPVLNQPFKDPW
jgi:hypothetical protein